MPIDLPYTVTGTVVHGEKVGRTIGFPTANLSNFPEEIEAKLGVYLASCELSGGQKLDGLAYWGPRFIFGEENNSFEVFLYDFEGDLYGQKLAVTLTSFIRSPLPFTTIENLQAQLEEDSKKALKLLGKN